MKKPLHFCLTALFLLFVTGFAKGQSVGDCVPGTAKQMLEGENFKCMLLNQGDFFSEPDSLQGAYFWPKNDPQKRTLAYASAIWFGGKERGTGNVFVSAQTYRQGSTPLRTYWPGPISYITGDPTPTADSVCSAWNRIFYVTKATVDSFIVLSQNSPGPFDIPLSIREWPGRGNPFLRQAFGNVGFTVNNNLAPFVDKDSNGIYEPFKGDYPDIGNKLTMAWWVMNDVGNLNTFSSSTPARPGAGFEFHFSASTYPSSPAAPYLQNAAFFDLKFYNKGSSILDSCYIGLWSDLDIGNAGDDFIQCDVMRNLGFSYNGDNFDEGSNGYGAAPPVFAYKILAGPNATENDGVDNNRNGITDEDGEQELFSSFCYMRILDNEAHMSPDTMQHKTLWNALHSKRRYGIPVVYDGDEGLLPIAPNRPRCKFIFPGTSDPYGYGVGGTLQNPLPMPEWTQITAGHTPGDQRMLMSAGPFTTVPGSFEQFSFVTLIAAGAATNLDNINNLYTISDSLDHHLPLLTEAKKPKLANVDRDGILFPNPASEKVTLSWLNTKSAPVRYQLVDVCGRIIHEERVEQSQTSQVQIPIADLKSGIYHIILNQKDGKQVRRKLIKL